MVPLDELMPRRIPSVNPAKHPDDIFELWSIPAFDVGVPEIQKGSEIGSSKKCVEPGDVLLSRIVPHIRRSWIVKKDNELQQIASGEWITFRGEQFFPSYLRHILVSDNFHSQFMKTVAGIGGSLLRARPEEVRGIKIPLPPLPEQKRIAAILDQAGGLRRLRQRAIEKLNSFNLSIFYETFGGDLKKSPVKLLKEHAHEFRYGTSNKASGCGYPTLRIPNVVGGGINVSEIKYVSVTSTELNKLRLQDGDILFVRTNGNSAYVGRSAVFYNESAVQDGLQENNWIFASYLIRARLKDSLNPVFLKYFLASQKGKLLLRERSKTSAGQYNINTQGLGSIPIPDVARERQMNFAETVKKQRNIFLFLKIHP